MFGSKNGWERADYLQPGRPWRRAGADQRAFGWTAPPYLDRLRTEHAAFRERAGIIDMTSFGKTPVEGPGALPLLERACCNRIDRPVGAVVYTQMLDARGGILADVTVTRLAEDRFRVVSGAGAVDADRGWLVHSRRAEDPAVTIRDASDELGVIGLWGPAAREILQATTDDDVSRRPSRFAPRARSGSGRRRCSRSASPTSASWATSSTSSRSGPCRPTTC